MSEPLFPRGSQLSDQDAQEWAKNKDQYIRQLLIEDIEKLTERRLIVYFTNCDHLHAMIDPSDDNFLLSLLADCKEKEFDLLIETNGGFTDSTEKICSILQQSGKYRVIVPRRAKSNGTIIALSGTKIVMSQSSELGPIDPHVSGIPAEFIIAAKTFDQIAVFQAELAREQTKKLATNLLKTGMMANVADQTIKDVVEKIASRQFFHSHGSVINSNEAKALGLQVEELDFTSDIFKKIWLLRTLYQMDCERSGYSKIFETSRVSLPVIQGPQQK